MSVLRQIGAVTLMNLQSLPRRLGGSLVIVVGIGGVVAVLISVLAMSTGIVRTFTRTGQPDRVIVTRAAATSELTSNLSREATVTIIDSAGVKKDGEGRPIASAEFLTLAEIPIKGRGSPASLTMRGVGPQAFALRPEIKLVEGRMFRPSVRELIVGKSAQAQFDGLSIGSHIAFHDDDWTVVGSFVSRGDSHDAELWGDSETMQSAYRRNGFSAVTVRLESPASFDAFKAALTANPALTVDVRREADYYAEQSGPLSRTFAAIAYGVGGIMALGALFGALNAMYAAVSTRSREIATLRAIGFGAFPVVISVLVEALLLSLAGAIIGAAVAWLFFNGNTVRTSGGAVVQIVYPLTVTPELIVLGIVWAVAIGMIGGLLPAIRAARLPVATALRET